MLQMLFTYLVNPKLNLTVTTKLIKFGIKNNRSRVD